MQEQMHKYLLPHTAMVVGLWMIPATLIVMASIAFWMGLTIGYAGLDQHVMSRFIPMIGTAGSVLFTAAMFLIAFSREKYEDEMIDDIRIKSIAISVTLTFLIFIAGDLFLSIREYYSIDFSFVDDLTPGQSMSQAIDEQCSATSSTRLIFLNLVTPAMLFLYYEIIFRIKLFLVNRGLRDE